MSAVERRIDEVGRQTILVMAVPYVLATALAFNLRARYNVVAPDLDAGETVPSKQWDGVLSLAGVPIPTGISRLVIELPDTSFDEPVMVTVNDRTTPVHVTGARAIQEVVALLEHHLSAA